MPSVRFRSARSFPQITKAYQHGLAILVLAVGTFGCAVSRTRRIAPSQLPPPPREATLAQLIANINSQSAAVQTLSATVDLEPSAGSIYSGVITQYHDLRGFILVRQPEWIRMVGQAPVVRTDLFDMASNGKRFSLYIPSKEKFYVGTASLPEASRNSLQNLRPQHVVEALLLKPIDATRECYFREEVENGAQRDYVVFELDGCAPGSVKLKRKVWFDRSNLLISRVQLYGPAGAYVEDIHYFDYQDIAGMHYPTRITIDRPLENYSLTITILDAKFNQPIPLSKFALPKPPSAQLVRLNSASQSGVSSGQ